MTKEQPTIYVGIDVSKDKLAVALAGGGLRDEAVSLGTFETAPARVGRLLKMLSARGASVSVCYEAGPTGYGLYRQVRAFGFECCVVAPSLIPVRAGERVKTDRLDAIRLARLFRAGELTPIWVSDETHEAMRDMVRARENAAEYHRHKRQLVSAFMLRHGQTTTGPSHGQCDIAKDTYAISVKNGSGYRGDLVLRYHSGSGSDQACKRAATKKVAALEMEYYARRPMFMEGLPVVFRSQGNRKVGNQTSPFHYHHYHRRSRQLPREAMRQARRPRYM
ncbi:transposase [Yoonia sp.]|uniref:IS110 family transposase n=1 Tax=Yoonia sp. TaxID=2212373 RepID=UPI003974D59A